VIEKLVSGLQGAGVSAEGEIREANYGHIAATILKVAAERGARIVVLGSSSRTDLPRIPLGSVANRLLHMATRPVLIVPRTDTPTPATPAPEGMTPTGEH
jgi:nucleotide-binding universal stress UspA family protein